MGCKTVRPKGRSKRNEDRKAAMFWRKLFWNLGGKLPVWMIHPGQIILLVERKLSATLFKGATLPAWWTPNVVPGAIIAVGAVAALPIAVTGALLPVKMFADESVISAMSERRWMMIDAGMFVGGLFVAGLILGVTGRLSTIWSWRHLRVAVCAVGDIGDRRAACKIAREPCVFEHVGGLPAQERFVHWFWGPTLGSRDWKFRFRPVGEVGTETNHSYMIVSDHTGTEMSFNVHEMMDVDNIWSWRGRSLYGAHMDRATSWFALLVDLLAWSSVQHRDAQESVARLSNEAGLQRMELAAWSDVVGRQLAYHFESGRSTRPDKEVGERLREVSYRVIKAYMKHVRDLGLPGHDMNKLEELFEAMNWPPLVSARKKRAPGTVTAYAEPATDDSR